MQMTEDMSEETAELVRKTAYEVIKLLNMVFGDDHATVLTTMALAYSTFGRAHGFNSETLYEAIQHLEPMLDHIEAILRGKADAAVRGH
jgi:hypothetical protein